MKKQILNYTFDKTAKTVTFTDYATIRLDSILLIVNVTSNIIIYNFADSTKGGTVATNVLTLAYNTSAMNNADKLMIFYDEPTVSGSTRDSKVQQITTITSSTSETTVLSAVSGIKLDVYACIVVNTSATPVNVSFKDSTAGTTRFPVYVPAGETRGFTLDESGAWPQTTANNNWTATCSASVASVIISILAIKNI